jgi:signal transduction histidine kinase
MENGMYDLSHKIESNTLEATISRLRKRLTAGAEIECDSGDLVAAGGGVSAHPSIGRRIIWRLSALFICALVLSSVIFLFESWIHRVDHLDRNLRDVATQLAGAVERDSAGALRLRSAALAALQIAELPSLRYAVTDQSTGAIAEGSMPELVHETTPARGLATRGGGFNFTDAVGQSERGYAIFSAWPVGRLRVIVSSPNLNLAETMAWMQDEALNELLPVLAPLFVGVLLVAPFTIRRSLLPLDRLSAQAALIEPAHTDVRLQEDGVPSEILPLVRKINEALARIDEGFEQQRRFTSNAAHELRTPLAILRARIDGLKEGTTKSGLIRDLERMSRLVSQLLLAGRLELQAPAPDVVVDLAEVASETVERMTPLRAASEHPLKLLLPGNPIKIQGDAESLGDALRNLIENAFAHSPPGAPVEIEVTPGGAIEVRDSGHGVPAKNRKRIFERFWRGERATGDGAGLGLSIVQAIATRHRGTVTVGDNPGGGAVFRLQFPVSNARPTPATSHVT